MNQAQKAFGQEWSDTSLLDEEDIADALRADEDEAFYELMARRGSVIQATDVAEYAADLARELAVLCRGARMDLVAYMLDVAAQEAEQHRDAAMNASRLIHVGERID